MGMASDGGSRFFYFSFSRLSILFYAVVGWPCLAAVYGSLV